MLDRAYLDAVSENQPSRVPMIEMTIPSSLDPTLAPPGHHVCLFFTQYTPYDIEGGWTEEVKSSLFSFSNGSLNPTEFRMA